MFGRLLALVFNRWTLLALIALVLAAAVWWVGPAVSIYEHSPLETAQARWIAIAIVVGVLALAVIWGRWRARHGNRQVVEQLISRPEKAGPVESADLAAVRERFERSLQTLRAARFGAPGGTEGRAAGWWRKLGDRLGGRYLYELPWYVIIGAPGSGKTTALRNAGLNFPLATQIGEQAVRGVGGTRNCDWWFTDRAVLLDTAGRFTTQDSDQAADKATWMGFLGLLKRSRPRQPLNGVMVTVSVPDLVGRSSADRSLYAQTVRQRLQELHEHLGIRFPIYLLVTKCDLMAGFGETFAALDKEQRATPWGYTFAPDTPFAAQPFDAEFDALLLRLTAGLVERLQTEPDLRRRAPIYGFPNQFANLRAPLAEFIQQVYAPSPFEAEPMLRGVYFVSGTQEGSPIDRVLGAVARRYRLEQAMLPPQQASGRSYFLQRLLTEVVFEEHGLAGTNRMWERRRSALVAGGYAAIALLSATMIGLWTWSWRGNAAYVGQVAQRVQVVGRQVHEAPNSATPDLLPVLDALEATRGLALASERGGSAQWSLGFGLYQGRKLDSAARTAYERMLVDAVLPRLALRVEEQLRGLEQPETQYEALKAYLMMYEPQHFDAQALKRYFEADWDARQVRELGSERRALLSLHLDALLALGAAVSPLPRDQALIDSTRLRLASVPLAERVYQRLRKSELDGEFKEFTLAAKAGANAQAVFTRAGGAPLTRGVPGLFTYDGYFKGFLPQVDQVTRQLASEQTWVLGIAAADAKSALALMGSGGLVDDVRRLYLNEYRDRWKDFIASIRLQPITSLAQAVERTRFLAAADSPLPRLLKAISRETSLLANRGPLDIKSTARKVQETLGGKVREVLGAPAPSTGAAPGAPIESIVDDEFAGLRRFVTAPEGGGPAPIDAVVGKLAELQVMLSGAEAALKGGSPPPPSPLPNQIRVEAANAPGPLRSALETLAEASARMSSMQLRESLAREVRTQIGDFCQQAISGRYPFDASSAREVTPADFAALFGPGGKFDLMQQKLAPYIDTSTKPWSFRAVDGTPLGADSGTLPQFQRAATIRETFFSGGGPGPSLRLEFKPLEMDVQLRELVLDVDGQIVRYDHGPQIPKSIVWPGPRGSGVVRLMVQPAGGTGMVNVGPWALFRLFERVSVQPGSAPEKFRVTFDVDGRKAVFEVTTASVRNPLRLPELRSFSCPNGL